MHIGKARVCSDAGRNCLRRLTLGCQSISSKESLPLASRRRVPSNRTRGEQGATGSKRFITLGLTAIMASPRRLDVNESANITVVRFKDQKIIDPEAIQELGQELFDLVEKEDRRKIILNFANVEFLSSAALGKLITFEKKAKRIGAELILTNISPEIFQVFAITNLDKLFQDQGQRSRRPGRVVIAPPRPWTRSRHAFAPAYQPIARSQASLPSSLDGLPRVHPADPRPARRRSAGSTSDLFARSHGPRGVDLQRHSPRQQRRPGKKVQVDCRLSPTLLGPICDEGAGFKPSAVPDCCAPDRLEVPGGRGLP